MKFECHELFTFLFEDGSEVGNKYHNDMPWSPPILTIVNYSESLSKMEMNVHINPYQGGIGDLKLNN